MESIFDSAINLMKKIINKSIEKECPLSKYQNVDVLFGNILDSGFSPEVLKDLEGDLENFVGSFKFENIGKKILEKALSNGKPDGMSDEDWNEIKGNMEEKIIKGFACSFSPFLFSFLPFMMIIFLLIGILKSSETYLPSEVQQILNEYLP